MKVQKEIESLVKFHLKCLTQEGEKIPVETTSPILTTLKTNLPEGAVVVGA